jgi:hypothetical protein
MVLDERALPVTARFELAARRIVEEWVAAGQVKVSAGDMKIAGEFLEQAGFSVEHAIGTIVKLRSRNGAAHELTREAAFMLALRRLAERR